MGKKCSKCGKFGKFCKDNKSSDGLQSQCKKCKSKGVCAYQSTPKGKEYRKQHQKKWNKKYAIKHPEKLRAKSLRYYRNNKISCCISRVIRRSLNGNKNGCKWQQLVGFSLEQLKSHLEKLFQHGMTWENYGEWQIDHIKPISSFSFCLSSDPDFKECWSLKNLQPLWKKDNLIKGNRF